MQRSDAPHQELIRAKLAVVAMRKATTLNQFEESWKEYLGRIERTWNKISNHFGKSPKWNSWQGPFDRQRRQDSLLSYLVNARGAEEHTVKEIVARELGGIGINPAFGNRIDHLEISNVGGQMNIKTTQPLKIEFIPGRIALLPVVNRGRTYPVPNAHLGKTIDPTDVPALAELGVVFYENALARAQAYFVK